MSDDARYEDGGEAALRLKALDDGDLQILSSLVQDAVFPITEMSWQKRPRRFALLLNRFRWEDLQAAEQRHRPVERVQSLLVVGDVMKVSSQGLERDDKDTILSLLSIGFEPGEDGTGQVILTLAGDGTIALAVEALDVTLRDVTRPYAAPSKRTPEHPE